MQQKRSRSAATGQWRARARVTPVRAIAAELALEGRCAACGAHRLELDDTGLEWRCRECRAGGGALEFVSYALRGCALAELGDAARSEVREWCRERLLQPASREHGRAVYTRRV